MPPTGRRGKRIEIALPWCVTRCGSTFGLWNSARKKNETARDIPYNQRSPRNRLFGNRRQLGRQNSPRRGPALSVCSARQKKARGCPDSRQRNRVSLFGYGSTHHIRYPGRAIGSSLERGRWYEDALCGKPAQCGYGFPRSIRETRCATEPSTDARGLRGPPLLSRMRSKLTAARPPSSRQPL